ncbi:hypothetical protein TrVE_jg7377 [Triparma verrucosa]|uniref:TPR-like protein n=1 Tax=Triparma verrucosa TaxID=1606542 RepID=A0A9W7ERT4_9STRA|nr:hypothetical protein TrVE_jg7377 [Triparma verrucosa]
MRAASRQGTAGQKSRPASRVAFADETSQPPRPQSTLQTSRSMQALSAPSTPLLPPQNDQLVAVQTPTGTRRASITKERALTPAQQYREKLRSQTPLERQMRRLEWRWEKNEEAWIESTLRIQKLQRGIASRTYTDSLKAHKQSMQSSCKIILQAGQDVTRGKYDDAIFTLSRAIAGDPSSRLAHLVRGRAYYCIGEDDKALNDFTTCLADINERGEKDELLRMRILLGDIYHRPLTTFERLKTFVTGTLADSFHDPQLYEAVDMVKICAYANRGRVNLRVRNYEIAVEDFTEVIESRGEHGDIPSMYFFRGLTYCKLHDWNMAVEDFSLNIGLTETDPEAYIRRAGAYSALQDWQKALDDLTTVVELDANAKVYTLRGRLLCCMRNWEEAVLDYRRALAMDKTYELARIGLENATREQEPLPLVSKHNN